MDNIVEDDSIDYNYVVLELNKEAFDYGLKEVKEFILEEMYSMILMRTPYNTKGMKELTRIVAYNDKHYLSTVSVAWGKRNKIHVIVSSELTEFRKINL